MPQIEDAREQIKESLEAGKPANTQAVKRLETILGHLRLPEPTDGLHPKRPFNAEIKAGVAAANAALGYAK